MFKFLLFCFALFFHGQLSAQTWLGKRHAIVYDLSFRPDGNRLAYTQGKNIEIADPEKMDVAPVVLKNVHQEDIICLAYSHDGTKIVSGDKNGQIVLWDAERAQAIRSFRGNGSIIRIKFSPDDASLAVASSDQSFYLYDALSGKQVQAFQDQGNEITDIDFFNSDTLFISGSDKYIKMYSIARHKIVHQWQAATNWIRDICFNIGKTRLASCGDNKELNEWDISHPDSIKPTVSYYDSDWIMSVDYYDSTVLGSGGNSRQLRCFNNQFKYHIGTGKNITRVSFRPGQPRFILACATYGNGVFIIEVADMKTE